jgi:ribonuclease Y
MKHEQELERISGLTQEEAVKEQLQRVEEELSQDIAILVKLKQLTQLYDLLLIFVP